MDEGCRAVAVDDVVGEEAPAGRRTDEGGVSRVLAPSVYECKGRITEGMRGGTMAIGRACPKCGLSYESTPARFDHVTLWRHFRLRDRRGILRVGAVRPISKEEGVPAHVEILG